jgi:invasion protein IalB
MSLSFERVGAAVLAGCLVFAGGVALAQTQRPAAPQPAPAKPAAQQAQAPAQPAQPGAPGQPPGPMRVDLVGMQADWTKVCGHDPTANKDICYTTRDFGTAPNQQAALALAVYDIKGDDQRIVRMLLPVGLLLKPGFRFAIDSGAALEGDFEICFPNGCFAESKVKGPTIEQLKKGTSLAVAVKNQANAEVTFVLPLAGFGKAFDGPAIDPKVLEQQQQQQQALQQEMQKRADAERQRLESAPGTPDAAPGAAAPAGHLAVPATPGQ